MVIISEYSAFYPISFGDPIQRYSLLKMRGENQPGPLFTIVNCVDAWIIALELDNFVFISLTLEDDIVFY